MTHEKQRTPRSSYKRNHNPTIFSSFRFVPSKTPAATDFCERHLAALVEGDEALTISGRRQLGGRDLEQAALGGTVEGSELDRLAASGLLAEGQAVGLVGDGGVGLQGSRSGGGGWASRGGSADIPLGSLLAILAGLAVLVVVGAGLASLASGASVGASVGSRGDLALGSSLSRSGGGHLGVGAGDVPDVEVGALGGDLGGRDGEELAGRGAGVGGEAEDEGLAGGVGLAGLLAELCGGDGRLAQRSLGAGAGGGDVAAVTSHERAGDGGGGGHGGEDDDLLEGSHFDCWGW